MTTTAQTIEMTYVVKGGAAHAELARLQAQEDKLGAASGAAARGLAQLEQGMGRVGTSAAAASRDMGRLDGSLSKSIGTLKGVQDGMGKSAGALAAMAGALGQGESKAAKFGQAAVGLAGAFAAGGPLLAGFTAATFAGEALYSTWREGKANSLLFQQGVDAIGPSMHRLVEASLNPARQATQNLLEELRNFGKDARQIAIDNNLMVVQSLEQRQATLDKRLKDATAKRDAAGIGVAGDRFDLEMLEARQAVVDTLTVRAAALPGEIAAARTELEALTRAATELDAKEAERNRNKGGATVGKGPAGNTLEDWQGNAASRARAEFRVQRDAAQKELDAAIDDANKKDAVLNAINDRVLDNEIRAYQFAEDYKTRIAREAADERAAIAKSELERSSFFAAQAMVAVAGTVAETIAAGATADEVVVAALSQLSRIAGGAVMLEGGKLMAAGIAGALSASPLAPGQLAGGAALIAAGAAITVGGPAAISAIVSAGSGGGGSRGSGSGSSGASTERGTSTPRMSSAGSGAPTTTVVNLRYGGPMGRVAEDTARDIVKLQRTNGRRGR